MLADSHSGRRVKSVRVRGVVLLKGRSTLWGTRSTADLRVKAGGAAPDEVGGERREVKQEDGTRDKVGGNQMKASPGTFVQNVSIYGEIL